MARTKFTGTVVSGPSAKAFEDAKAGAREQAAQVYYDADWDTKAGASQTAIAKGWDASGVKWSSVMVTPCTLAHRVLSVIPTYWDHAETVLGGDIYAHQLMLRIRDARGDGWMKLVGAVLDNCATACATASLTASEATTDDVAPEAIAEALGAATDAAHVKALRALRGLTAKARAVKDETETETDEDTETDEETETETPSAPRALVTLTAAVVTATQQLEKGAPYTRDEVVAMAAAWRNLSALVAAQDAPEVKATA